MFSKLNHIYRRLSQRIAHELKYTRTATLKPSSTAKGNILLVWDVEPFLHQAREQMFLTHTRFWEFVRVAQLFLDQGYRVDIVDWRNGWFIPKKPYDFCFDTRFQLDRLTPLLNPDCTKVLYGQTAHINFHNQAECRRLLDLQYRRGVVLKPNRYEKPTRAFDNADCATILGNAAFTRQTYRYIPKPLYLIRNSTAVTYPWPSDKNFERCRNHFLWFASGGMVHKGLDLALEAFAAMPEYHLTVCGPVEQEPDFVEAYHKELYDTPNIHTVGWIDVSSQEFIDIARRSVALVYPSCSEGQSGAVITCMHAGLIPIMSHESGVDSPHAGSILRTCSIEEIQQIVRAIATLPSAELAQQARAAWEFARNNYTKETFTQDYQAFVTDLLNGNLRQNNTDPFNPATLTAQHALGNAF